MPIKHSNRSWVEARDVPIPFFPTPISELLHWPSINLALYLLIALVLIEGFSYDGSGIVGSLTVYPLLFY